MLATSLRAVLLALALGDIASAGGKEPKEKKHDKEKHDWHRMKNEEIEQAFEKKTTRYNEMKEKAKQETLRSEQQGKQISELTTQLAARGKEIASLTDQLKNTKPSDQTLKSLSEKSQQLAQLSAQVSSRDQRILALTQSYNQLADTFNELRDRYEDPSLQHFLSAKATKVYNHPGIKNAANKTYTYVLPWATQQLSGMKATGSRLYNSTLASVHGHLSRFVDEDRADHLAPWTAGFLIYSFVIVPAACAVCVLFDWVCRLKPLLSFCHLYLTMACLLASFFATYTKVDPLLAFQQHDGAVYYCSLVAVIGVLIVYFCALSVAIMNDTDGLLRVVQFLGAGVFASGFYFMVWTPAMVDEMPKVHQLTFIKDNFERLGWVPYAVPAVFFCLNFVAEEYFSTAQPEEKKE